MREKFFKRITNIFLVVLMLISYLPFAVYGEEIETEKITVTIHLDDGFSIKDSEETIINSSVKEDGNITPVDIYLDEDMADSFSDDLVSCLNEYETFKNNNLSVAYDKGNHMLTISGTPIENVEINLNDILSKIVEENDGYNVEEISSDGAIIYVSSSGDDSNNGYSAESPVQDLATAYSKVTSSGKIILLNDIEQSSTLNLNSNKTVTITSYDNNTCSIKRGSSFNDTLLNIASGSITLSNITVDGSNKGSDFLVKVGASSGNPSLTLDSGATITNNAKGGILLGVSDSNSGKTSSGTLNIKSGSKITNMTGCGKADGYTSGSNTYHSTASAVLVLGSNTTFNMTGGEITNNDGGTDSYGTIVFFYNRGTSNSSIISGGTISNNTNGKGAGAIFLDEGGRVILSGGTIQNNTSGSNVNGAVSAWNSSTDDTKKQDLYIGGGTNPLIITDNKDKNNDVCNLRIISGKIIQRASTSSLAEGSKIGISINTWPSSGNPTQIVSSVTEIEEEYFESDYKTKAGILRESTGGLYLSADYRKAQNLYVKADYTGGSSDGTRDKPYTSIATAYSNAINGDTIVLLGDITQSSTISINKNIEVTLTSYGTNTYTITRNANLNLFNISNGTLTLKNVKLTDSSGRTGSRTYALILVGGLGSGDRVAKLVLDNGTTITNVGMSNAQTSTEYGVIVVGGTGTLTMNDGATISNCTAGSGPVRLGNQSNAGLFYMNGGTIENCDSKLAEGSAVYIASNSIMYMSDGVIKDCGNSSTKGTIYLHDNKVNTFVMSGGEITNNKATYGGGVYSNNNNSNIIKISGTAKIYGNTGTASSLNGESNIYLSSGQTITIGDGGMSDGANVGVYTASTVSDTNDVKFATNASSNDIYYFHSDKQTTAGVLYCDGTSDTVTGHHTTHASYTLWLSTATAGYTVNITNIDGITTSDELNQSGINNSSKTFSNVTLSVGTGYQDFTDSQLSALNDALGVTVTDGITTSTSGLYAELSDKKIIIKALSSTVKKDVSINLADIFKSDNALKKCEAKIGDDYYSTLSAALDAASGNSNEDTIVIECSTVTAVTGKQLKANDILKDINGNTYKALIDSTVSVDTSGNVTLTSGKLDVNKKTDGDDASVNVSDYEVSGDKFSVNTDTSGIDLSVGSGNKASINNVSFEDGDFSISKDSSGNTVIKGNANNEGNYGGTVTGANNSGAIDIVDSNTTITAGSDGSIKLTGGSGKSSGKMIATIGGDDKTFTSVDSSSYTVDASVSKLTLNGDSSSDYSVKMGDITFSGKGEDNFIFGSDGSNMNVCVSNNASISNDTVTIKGVEGAIVALNGDFLVLIGGKGQVTGEATVKVKVTGGTVVKTVDVTVPSGKTYTIDANDKGVVSGLTIDDTVVVDGVTYTSGTDSSSFVLDNEYAKLTNTNDKISIPSTKTYVSVTLGDGDKPTIIVPSSGSSVSNEGDTTITKTNTGATVTLGKDNDTFKIDGKIYAAGSDNSSFVVDNYGNVKLNSGSIKLNPNCSVVGGSGKTIKNTSSISNRITVSTDGSKDTITAKNGNKVTIGEKEYEVTSDNTTIEVTSSSNKITSGSLKLDKDESIDIDDFSIKNTSTDDSKDITVNAGATDNKGTISIPDDGIVTIGKDTNEVKIESLDAENDTVVTITNDGLLKTKMPIKISGVEYTNDDSSAELTIDLNSGDVTVSNGTKVSDDSASITALEDNTKISKIDDSLTLVSGNGQVTGDVSVKISDEKIVDVSVPSGKSVTLNTLDKTASGLGKDASVTIDDITYTSGIDNGSFSLENAKLTKNGDKASVIGSVTSDKTISIGDSLNITVSKEDVGNVAITKTNTGATVSLDKSNDKFIVNETTYTSTYDNTTYSVSDDGTVNIIEIFKMLEDDNSYIGSSGKTIANPADSNNDEIKVTINSPSENIDTLIIPESGKVKINEKEYENASSTDDLIIEVSSDSNKIVSGSVKLDKDEDIKVTVSDGSDSKTLTIKNTDTSTSDNSVVVEAIKGSGDTAKITVPGSGSVKIGDEVKITNPDTTNSSNINIDEDGKLSVDTPINVNDTSYTGDSGTSLTIDPDTGKVVVTVFNSKKVQMGDDEYISANDNTQIEKGDSVNKLINGAVKLDKDETISVVNSKAVVKNLEEEEITVSSKSDGTGEVIIPSGKKISIGKAIVKASDSSGDTTATINTNGNVEVSLPITINDVEYTGDSSTKITVNPDTGKIIDISGNVTIDESALNNDDFSYDIKPGQSISIGKYVYTNNSISNNVTINGRGNNLNPSLTLKDADDKVKVTLENDSSKNTTYTAAASNTKFAMSKSDEDTKNIDLLDNGTTANSRVKNINGAIVNGGDNSIKAIDDDAQIELKNNKATLVSGKGSSNGKMIASINGNNKEFEKATGNSYTVSATDKTLEVPADSSVKSGAITYEKGKYTFNDDGTISINDTGKITGGNNSLTGDSNAKAKVSDDVIELVEGKATVEGKIKSNLGDADHIFNSEGSYTVDKPNNKLVVPADITVTDASGVKYIGEGEYTFNDDKAISLKTNATIASKDGGDDSSITGVNDAKVKVSDGNVSLISGSASSNGKMIASINGSDKDFELVSTNGSYEVDTSNSTLKVNSDSSVKSGGITYETGSYKFNTDNTIIVSGRVNATDGSSVKSTGSSNPTIKIDDENNIELISGSAIMYGKVKTTLANTAYTFVGNNGSYTINTSDNILNVPSGVTVTDNNGTKYVGPGEFKFNNDIDKTISLNTNATISTEKSVVVASDDDTKVKVIKDEGNNIVELVDGKANVKGETKTNLNGDHVFESVDNKEYTIDKASNKLTVLSNVTVKDDKGVIYKGEGSFIFNADTTIKVIDDATITSKEGGNGSSVTGTGNTTIKVDAGNVTLIGGKGKSTGKMFVKFKNTNLDVQSFNSDGASYTIDTSDTDSSITLNNGTEETKVSLEFGDKIKLIGKENDKFILDSNDSKTTIAIPNKARITGNANSTIEGDTDTSVEIDNEGNLALVSGRANLIGLTSIDVKYDSTKTVKVTAPINTVVNVDTANKKVTLSKDKSVRIGNVIYTASVDNSSFDLEDKKLTNDKEVATVLGNINEEVTISLDTLNITIPSTNSGDVSITKDSPLSIIKLSKKDDKFTINGTTYTSGSDDTTFSVDTDGNVKLVNGSVLLKKDESITGVGDKEITNNSDDVLTVISDDTKDIILIPLKEGKLKIGDIEYVTDSDNTKVSVDKNGDVKLVSGSVVLEDEQSIIGINSNKLIRNPGVFKLIVAIDDLKDVVTILNKDNKVKIDDSEYKSASDNTKIEMTVEFNKLISGSIKLEKDKSITGSSGKLITNIGDSVIVVSSDGTNDTITVPSSGKVKIDDETYKASGDTTILIKDGGIKVIGGNLKKNVVNTATGISANSNIFNYFLLMLVSIFVIIKLTKFGK